MVVRPGVLVKLGIAAVTIVRAVRRLTQLSSDSMAIDAELPAAIHLFSLDTALLSFIQSSFIEDGLISFRDSPRCQYLTAGSST